MKKTFVYTLTNMNTGRKLQERIVAHDIHEADTKLESYLGNCWDFYNGNIPEEFPAAFNARDVEIAL